MGNSGGRYFDGFLMGLLVGGVAVFLLGTKRGNKILKVLTEEGLDGLTKIIEDIEEKRETKPLPPTKPQPKNVEEKIDPESSPNGSGNGSPPHIRRFFKRSK